jgi:transcriptional regulator with AAA-type ATPase domain
MIHGFAEDEWNDYIEGFADEPTRDRIEAHLIGCLSCWELHEQMSQTTAALRSSSEILRSVFALQDQQLEDGLRAVFAQIKQETQSETSSQSSEVRARLIFLEAILARMCGAQTASKALRAAAKAAPTSKLNVLTSENWEPFLEQLTSFATVMCGDTGANLIRVSGKICFE